MKNSELKEYLNTFPEDANVSVIIADPKGRKLYHIEQYSAITDMGQPVFCLEVGEPKDFDAEMIAAVEEDERNAQQLEGQMNITDFQEVLP